MSSVSFKRPPAASSSRAGLNRTVGPSPRDHRDFSAAKRYHPCLLQLLEFQAYPIARCSHRPSEVCLGDREFALTTVDAIGALPPCQPPEGGPDAIGQGREQLVHRRVQEAAQPQAEHAGDRQRGGRVALEQLEQPLGREVASLAGAVRDEVAGDRRYGGWWDGEPDNLLPAPRPQQAREWVALAGGVGPVLQRVALLEAQGDLRMASHLVEMAALADPDSTPAFDARARVYAARSAEQMSTMSRGIFNHFAKSSQERVRDRLSRGSE